MKPDRTTHSEPGMNKRTVWVKTEFDQLKPDDLFRMFEPTGEPVIGTFDGSEIFKASDFPSESDGLKSVRISGGWK